MSKIFKFKFEFKRWEIFLITLSVLFFLLSFVIYLSEFPLRKYLFDISDDDVHAPSNPIAQVDNFIPSAIKTEIPTVFAPISIPSIIPSRKPSPSPLPSPSRSPSPAPSKPPVPISVLDKRSQVKTLLPNNGTVLKLEGRPQTFEKSIVFKWSAEPPKAKVLLTLWKLNENPSPSKKETRIEVTKAIIEAKQGIGEFTWVLQTPGLYEWNLETPYGESFTNHQNTRARFKLNSEFLGITSLATLVAGQNSTSNNVKNNLQADFEFTLRWEEVPKAQEYKISFFQSQDAKQSVLEHVVKKPEFAFNKQKIISNHIYYKVTTPRNNGFIATSGLQEFSFTFLPPNPVAPSNNTVFTYDVLKQEKFKILYTWQKTNFTFGYEFEMSHDANFTRVFFRRNMKENYFILPSPPTGTYWWRVRGFSRELSSPMSTPFSFTISPE